jgi:hypothetical protein
MNLKAITPVLFISLFIVSFADETLHEIKPVIGTFQTLQSAKLNYKQREQIHEDPVVKELNKKLSIEYSQTKGTCFVELPYNELVQEGLGSEHPLGGQWTYRIEKTDYTIYPFPVDWGYSKNSKLYRIVFGYGITAHSEQVNPDDYPCIIGVDPDEAVITIKGIPDVP